MEYLKLTEQDMKESKTYLPLADKMVFVEYAADRCFDRMNVTMDDGTGLNLPMAPMYKENTALKSRYLMGALVRAYLGKSYEPVEGDDWLMAQDDYDRWAGSHIFNQLERMKGCGGQVREIVFDLLADYRDLEKRLTAEMRGMRVVMNEPVNRIIATMQSQTTPEAFAQGKERLDELTAELEEYRAAKEAKLAEGNEKEG